MKKNWLFSILIGLSPFAHATSSDIGFEALFIQSLTVSNINNIDFGRLSGDSTSSGGGIVLSPNGQINMGTSGFLSLDGQGTSGSFEVNSSSGSSINISCTSTGLLAHETQSNIVLSLNSVHYNINNPNNSAIFCDGDNYDFTSSSQDTIYVGGTLFVSPGSTTTLGQYSTSNAGGIAIHFSISYE
ncbi:MAG: DUF4402 domain-containing protein [Shewanellaceae bacterium]|nr:DUF4402 domain-containing protein [Shewanellaceae bacterium]